MIKTTAMIMNELKNYASPANKLKRLVKEKKYIPIIRGLYETDRTVPGYLLAESIYGPSYLSFEFALAYHGLIPEAVYTFTSATFEKKKKKKYVTEFGTYLYGDVPSKVFPFEIEIVEERGYCYKIATAEKALCDQLYKMKRVENYKEMRELLFQDLRLNETLFSELDVETIAFLADKYGSMNVKRLAGMMQRERK